MSTALTVAEAALLQTDGLFMYDVINEVLVQAACWGSYSSLFSDCCGIFAYCMLGLNVTVTSSALYWLWYAPNILCILAGFVEALIYLLPSGEDQRKQELGLLFSSQQPCFSWTPRWDLLAWPSESCIEPTSTYISGWIPLTIRIRLTSELRMHPISSTRSVYVFYFQSVLVWLTLTYGVYDWWCSSPLEDLGSVERSLAVLDTSSSLDCDNQYKPYTLSTKPFTDEYTFYRY